MSDTGVEHDGDQLPPKYQLVPVGEMNRIMKMRNQTITLLVVNAIVLALAVGASVIGFRSQADRDERQDQNLARVEQLVTQVGAAADAYQTNILTGRAESRAISCQQLVEAGAKVIPAPCFAPDVLRIYTPPGGVSQGAATH